MDGDGMREREAYEKGQQEDGEALLEIRDLSVSFRQYVKGTAQEELPVISNLNVTVRRGEIMAVVGASGSGKSLLAEAVMGLLPSNARVEGELIFKGEPLDCRRLEKLRGKELALVPQSVACLDPLMKAGGQVRMGRKDAASRSRQKELFRRYRLPEGTEEKYPFQCSGGMNRRLLLTMALMEEPELLIADEPTPGLELALAREAMGDFRALADEGKGVLLITHDIELAMETADRITVFYAGTTVEEALAADFASEETLRHPYTRALWRAMPRNGFQAAAGNQPYVKNLPAGCAYGPRCSHALPECGGKIPECRVRGGRVWCTRWSSHQP